MEIDNSTQIFKACAIAILLYAPDDEDIGQLLQHYYSSMNELLIRSLTACEKQSRIFDSFVFFQSRKTTSPFISDESKTLVASCQ
ncbi:hypothetical protein [Dongshaea marina]|uniref:hypothetical protein n=1 Tax=Dongshaea marina TaxID=2047966 RepID=UPI00131F21C9|nr:hypothetical protein [Dongshaea marina]